MGNTFNASTEAFQQDCAQLEFVNDSGEHSAQRMRIYLEDVPAFVQVVADGLRELAEKAIETVLLDPGGEEVLHMVSQNIQSQVDALKELQADMDRIHDDRVRHMRSEDSRAGSWDWKGNQDEDLASA